LAGTKAFRVIIEVNESSNCFKTLNKGTEAANFRLLLIVLWRIFNLKHQVTLVNIHLHSNVELDDKLLEVVVLDVEERLLNRQLLAVAGVTCAVSKNCFNNVMQYFNV